MQHFYITTSPLQVHFHHRNITAWLIKVMLSQSRKLATLWLLLNKGSSRLNKEYVKVRSSSSTDWRWVLSISWKWKQWLVIKNIFNPLFFVGMGRGCWWMEYWAGKCTLGILSMSHEGYLRICWNQSLSQN